MDDTERQGYLDRMKKISDARDRAVEALKALVVQVERSNAVDDHGHELKHLMALADAKGVLGEYWPRDYPPSAD